MNPVAVLSYLSSKDDSIVHPGLGRMNRLAKALNHPERKFKSIHITGTNGKGSICAMLESILRSSGYKTGLYTSPHLQDVRERIQVNGKKIPQHSFYPILQKIETLARGMGIHLTYFEILTAVAFSYFAEKSVDCALLEVGLGGRWDATNIIPSPEISIITNVDIEHTQYLGNTIEEIAFEKAGIIKRGCLCLTASSKQAARILLKTCEERKAPFHSIGEIEPIEKYYKVCHLKGEYQKINIRIVLEAIRYLQHKKWIIPSRSVITGLRNVQWPGRFEWSNAQFENRKLPVLLDGAHNPAAVEACLKSIEKTPWKDKKVLLIFNALQDKDITKMVKNLMERLKIQKVWIPKLPTIRTSKPNKVKEIFLKYSNKIEIECFNSVPEMWKKTSKQNTLGTEWILLLGSFYLIGNCRNLFSERQ